MSSEIRSLYEYWIRGFCIFKKSTQRCLLKTVNFVSKIDLRYSALLNATMRFKETDALLNKPKQNFLNKIQAQMK